jgi:hypothetical protein
VNIERCFFNDFFRANDAVEVASPFCALDKVWAEALRATSAWRSIRTPDDARQR